MTAPSSTRMADEGIALPREDTRWPIRLLHLSDLHYGKLDAVGAFRHRFKPHGFVDECIAALREEFPDRSNNANHLPGIIDCLVISGDFVCQGSRKKEHEHASSEVARLCDVLGIQDSRVIVVPGNHDIDRTQPSDARHHYEESFARWIKPPCVLADSGHDGLWFLPLDTTQSNPDKLLPEPVKRYLTKNIAPNISGTVAWSKTKYMLNARGRHHARMDKHFGWTFDQGCLDASLETLKTVLAAGPPPAAHFDPLIIAVMHHNPISWPRHFDALKHTQIAEHNMLANGPEVLDMLRRGRVSLVLHGHRHMHEAVTLRSPAGITEAGARREQRPITIVSAPPAGLSLDELQRHSNRARSTYNGFNVIELWHSASGWWGTLRAFHERGKEPHDSEPTSASRVFNSVSFRELRLGLAEPSADVVPSIEGARQLIRGIVGASGPIVMLHYSSSNIRWSHSAEGGGATIRTPIDELHDYLSHSAWRGLRDAAFGIDLFPILKAIESHDSIEITDLRRAIGAVHKEQENPHERLWTSPDCTGDTQVARTELQALGSGSHRWAPYAMEVLRGIMDPAMDLTKCVYISPRADDGTGTEDDTPQDEVDAKFEWLIRSAWALRHFPMVRLSWLPFCFRPYRPSFVTISYGNKGRGVFRYGQHPSEFMAGWPHDIQNDPAPAVVTWCACDRHGLGMREFGTEMSTIMREMVSPIAERSVAGFPLLINHRIHVENLRMLGNLLSVPSVSDLIETHLAGRSDDDVAPDDGQSSVRRRRLTKFCRFMGTTAKATSDSFWGVHELRVLLARLDRYAMSAPSETLS